MKVNDIVLKEERLDELAPIIVGGMAITWGAITAAITAAFIVWTLYDVFELLERNNFIETWEDVEDISEDDWFIIGLMIGFAGLPWARKGAGWLFNKVFPDSWKSQIARFTKNQFMKKFKKATPAEKDITKPAKQSLAQKANLPPAAEKAAKAIGYVAGVPLGSKADDALNTALDNIAP